MSLALFLVTALVLGIRHALEPDHLVAVSTLVAEERRLWPAARLGLIWGVGHLLPLTLIGLPVLLLRLKLPEAMENTLDLGVGLLLIGLGLLTLWRLRKERIHFHLHEHGKNPHAHFHAHSHETTHAHPHQHPKADTMRRGWVTFGFGLIHGLAGSGAAAALALSAAPSLPVGVGYLLAFGLGTCLGMFGMTLCIAAPALSTLQRFTWAQSGVRALAGVMSIGIGVLLWVEILSAKA